MNFIINNTEDSYPSGLSLRARDCRRDEQPNMTGRKLVVPLKDGAGGQRILQRRVDGVVRRGRDRLRPGTGEEPTAEAEDRAGDGPTVASGERRTGEAVRYRTLKSRSCERRVGAKAEHLPQGENPRLIVTSVSIQDCDGRTVHEAVYYVRGDMENRIKEQQLGLFLDRTCSSRMQRNQLRTYFSTFAYVKWRRCAGWGGRGRSWHGKLLKIWAQIPVITRTVCLSFTESYPYAALLRTILVRVQALRLRCWRQQAIRTMKRWTSSGRTLP